MEFDWDEAKRQSNLHKHRLDFLDAKTVLAGATFTFADERFGYDEDRYITLGMLREGVVVIAHTERAEMVRIISMRKATKNEQKIYFAGFSE